MPQDKQLTGISLEAVVQKRSLDQALNAKEFAVLAGISYSAARTWFRSSGFPYVCGVVFWVDLVQSRKVHIGLVLQSSLGSNNDVAKVESEISNYANSPCAFFAMLLFLARAARGGVKI